MQAILLATGESNPLRPLTEVFPSPMLPLVNRPVMVYALELLARQGFKQIFVSLHDNPGKIEAYFGTGRRWGVNLNYLLQRDAWGTAGALRWAGHVLTEPFIVVPAHVLADVDLAGLIDQHRVRGPQATVVVHQVYGEDEYDCGDLTLASTGAVTHIGHPGDPQGTWKDTGVYIFEPGVLDLIPARTPFDIHHQLLPAMLKAGLLVDSYQMQGYWNPLDTFQKLHEAQRVYLYSAWGNYPALDKVTPLRFPVVEGRQVAPGIWVGRNHVIHPRARIAPPVCVGENCQIGKDAEIGPEAIVGDYVVVDDEATICQTTVLDHTYVGELVNLEKRIVNKDLLIDTATAQCLYVSDPFLLSSVPLSAVRIGVRSLINRFTALLLLLLLSPVLLVLGLLMLISTGRIFCASPRQSYQSNRTNTGSPGSGSPFNMFRFCTRRVGGRTTRLGEWLEKWEGNRLLELWNVVRGDMLLVGIMPLDPKEAEYLTDPWQQKRNDYFPGFTGLWYVQVPKSSDQDEILVADVFYVATRTWLEDLKLFLRTPVAWIRRLREG